MQKGKAWRRGLNCVLSRPFGSAGRATQVYRQHQQHVGSTNIVYHPKAPSRTQWVSFRWFPKQPFPIFTKEASAGKKEWSPQWPHPKATENPSIQKQLFARTVLVVARTVLVVARLVLDVSWFCPSPVSARKRVFGPKTSRKRKTAENGPKNRPPKIQCSPRKNNRGVRPPKSKPFFRVPFLIMRKVLNQG